MDASREVCLLSSASGGEASGANTVGRGTRMCAVRYLLFVVFRARMTQHDVMPWFMYHHWGRGALDEIHRIPFRGEDKRRGKDLCAPLTTHLVY